MTRAPEIEFLESRLQNGLQVILRPDVRVPLLHLTLHYRVGSSYEEPGQSGFAHLFEHMMFQGSEQVPRNAHGQMVDAAGGSWNASTNKDRTNYYETLPAHFLELGLWLEADRMRALRITSESFENQRQTVIEEKKQSYDNRPYGRAFLRFDELAYQNWCYAHPIIGLEEDLRRATLEDVIQFHERYYGPGNATLVLSGDFDPDEALDKIDHYFGSISDRTQPQRPDLSEPTPNGPKIERLLDPLAPLPAVTIGYAIPQLGTPEFYALSMLALVLAHGESSRFYRRLLFERNAVTSISAGPNLYRGPEQFVISFQLQQEADPDHVVCEVLDELNRVMESGITEEELERARNQMMFRFVGRLATVSQVGEWLARYCVYFDSPEMINRELDRFLAVTANDVLEAAHRVFRDANRTTLFCQPGQDA